MDGWMSCEWMGGRIAELGQAGPPFVVPSWLRERVVVLNQRLDILAQRMNFNTHAGSK